MNEFLHWKSCSQISLEHDYWAKLTDFNWNIYVVTQSHPHWCLFPPFLFGQVFPPSFLMGIRNKNSVSIWVHEWTRQRFSPNQILIKLILFDIISKLLSIMFLLPDIAPVIRIIMMTCKNYTAWPRISCKHIIWVKTLILLMWYPDFIYFNHFLNTLTGIWLKTA